MTKGKNGNRHLGVLYTLVIAFGVSATGVIWEGGRRVQAQDGLILDGIRRDKQIGVMDNRQRKIERQAAITNIYLKVIQKDQKESGDVQKEILKMLREQRSNNNR